MKKIIIFFLLIICSLCTKAETWGDFFRNQIYEKLEKYPNKKIDFEQFKENIENKKYNDCIKFLEELENENHLEERNKSLMYTYYYKAFVLAFLKDDSAEDYLLMAQDINDYCNFNLDLSQSDLWDLAKYCSKYSKDSLVYQQTIKLEKELNKNVEENLFFKDNYNFPYQELFQNYLMLNRPIAIMRVEFYNLINNFDIQNTQNTLENCNRILQISQEKNITNFYTKLAEKISQKDYFDNYKKAPYTNMIIVACISLLIIIFAVRFGIKHKNK